MRRLDNTHDPLNRDITFREMDSFEELLGDDLLPWDSPHDGTRDDPAPSDPDDPWNRIYGALTPSQKAKLVEEYPAGELGLQLWGSPEFRSRAAIVRNAGLDSKVAHREAGAWVTKGLGRETIAWYLVEAAKAQSNLGMLGALGGAGRRKTAKDAPLELGQPQRRKLNVALAERGAHLLQERGEGICLRDGCSTHLTKSPARTAARRTRSDYCGACSAYALLNAESDAKAIKFVLDAAAARVLPNALDRQRARRRKRTSPRADLP
jgi:hypothetical protein